MKDESRDVREAAAAYVRSRGAAVRHLFEQAEHAEAVGDAVSAQAWQETAADAARIIGGDQA